MRNSDAEETSRRPATRAEWRRLDRDVQARLWAEVHKDDETEEGKPVLDCEHGNRVGECSLCGLAHFIDLCRLLELNLARAGP